MSCLFFYRCNMSIEVGSVFSSNAFGDFEIIKIDGFSKITVRFLDTGYTTTVCKQRVLRGSIKDRALPTLFGVGIIGDKYPTSRNGTLTREYKLWAKMLERCYNENYQRNYPTYKGCEVSKNFKSYEYFYEWCNRQEGFCYAPEWHLDKDLLNKGGKLYSEENCVFLPKEINVAFTKNDAKRGDSPVGVNKKGNKFVAWCKKGNNLREYLGTYDTKEQAFYAYKETKENYLKTLAEQYRDRLDTRAYNAIVNYKVSIDD